MKKMFRIIPAVIIGLVLTAGLYYVMLPPINVFSMEFWVFALMTVSFFGVPTVWAFDGFKGTTQTKVKVGNRVVTSNQLKMTKPVVIFLIVAAVPVAAGAAGSFLFAMFPSTRRGIGFPVGSS